MTEAMSGMARITSHTSKLTVIVLQLQSTRPEADGLEAVNAVAVFVERGWYAVLPGVDESIPMFLWDPV